MFSSEFFIAAPFSTFFLFRSWINFYSWSLFPLRMFLHFCFDQDLEFCGYVLLCGLFIIITYLLYTIIILSGINTSWSWCIILFIHYWFDLLIFFFLFSQLVDFILIIIIGVLCRHKIWSLQGWPFFQSLEMQEVVLHLWDSGMHRGWLGLVEFSRISSFWICFLFGIWPHKKIRLDLFLSCAFMNDW